MKIHEYQAAILFRDNGIPVCEGETAETVEQAQTIARRLSYPVVLKAQVLSGGRGKAGGVKVVHSPEELPAHFSAIKQLKIQDCPVHKIYVVKAVDIRREYYAAITLDAARGDVVAIFSSDGGVDIEETARRHPQAIHKFYLERQRHLEPERWQKFVRSLMDDAQQQEAVTRIFESLVEVFFKYDCLLAEINPLVLTVQDELLAADAKVSLDDNALFRHPELEALRDLACEDPEELEAKQNGLSFVKLDGNVGCIVNGAGLAMATVDDIKVSGGEPANFLDVGGSSNPQKVITALDIILRNPKVKVVLINIFGGITRCDDIAKGILEAKKHLPMTQPLVVRLAGTNEEEAKRLLSGTDMETCTSMREAVTRAVALAREAD